MRALLGWGVFALVLYVGIEWAFRIDAYEQAMQMRRNAALREMR